MRKGALKSLCPTEGVRVAVLARGLSVHIGGVRHYIEQMAHRLPVIDRQAVYGIFHNSPRHVGMFGSAEEIYQPGNNVWWWENVWFPMAVRRWGADIVFCPKNLVPLWLSREVCVVSSLLDMAYFTVRGKFLPEYRWRDVAYMRAFLPRSIRRANRLVGISEHTRRDVIELFGVQEEKIASVLLGVEVPSEEVFEKTKLSKVRAKYALHTPYIFYSGSLSPRKNMVRVIQAFASIADKVPHRLVVTAGKSWKDSAVHKAVQAYGLSDRFVILGEVPDEDMPLLYRMANLFVFVSLYEGFGLPVLEAMACGCPVLTSTATSLPEVAGEAAELVDPEDEKAIADKMLKLLTDDERCEVLREMGRRRAAEMSWDQTARSLSAIFHDSYAEACES